MFNFLKKRNKEKMQNNFQELFEKYAGIMKNEFEDYEKFKNKVLEKGYKVEEDDNFDSLFFKVFLNEIEGKLGEGVPCVLYDYPVSMAALSKKCVDEKYAQRFEVYIGGVELCNAFTELNDYKEQFSRLEKEREERKSLGKDEYEVDQSFVDALRLGMPPSGGNALGVDRLIMLILDARSIEEVLYFPFKDL